MRLILIRHGEAHAGFTGPIAGPRGCAGLTDLGRRQARALRDHLAATGRVRADVLISSVLPRAIETAQIIAPGLGLEVDEAKLATMTTNAEWTFGVDLTGVIDRTPQNRPSATA